MNLHVIIGSDDYLVGETAKKTIGDGTGLEVIDSLNSTNEETRLKDIRAADDSFSTPPFLDPRKVTWWKNVAFLPGGGKSGGKNDEGSERESTSEAVKIALDRFIDRLVANPLPENQHFILSGPHLLKTSIIAKKLATAAEVITFAAEKPWEAARSAALRANEFAAEMGLTFDVGAAERFTAIVGVDARSVRSELGKLRDYLETGTKKITAADVAAIASPGFGIEPEVWTLTDAIGQRNVARAIRELGGFETKKGFEIFMTGVIEKFFRQMTDVKRAQESGDSQALSRALEPLSPANRRKFTDFARNWSLNELRIARARFLKLRENVVSSTTSGGDLIFIELVRVMRKAAKQ